ncbi:hypothetical protein [Pseudomonas sp. zfem005]|uniref:hypothetical protein n=1 Tax=Pseudomonas sp. zfem005 TaxID=3078200 RepID=UPI002928386C|nr:hypothetical protein [Pseudomonas sp. zfem005]MDU9415439.1 hypothetical protein [Pseudomonas sp. zfem005]
MSIPSTEPDDKGFGRLLLELLVQLALTLLPIVICACRCRQPWWRCSLWSWASPRAWAA